MQTGWLDPDFTPIAAAVALLPTLYLVVLQPVLGRRGYSHLVKARQDGDREHVARFFRQAITLQWVLAALAVCVPIIGTGVELEHLGIAKPTGGLRSTTFFWTCSLLVGVVGGALIMRWHAGRGRTVLGESAYSALLPRNRRERRWAFVAAITAGVCEEVLYRGLLVAVGVGVFGLQTHVTVIIAVVVFSLTHLYQGWRGLLNAMVVGSILMALYLMSGSLLWPIIAHIAIDIRGLLVAGGTRPTGISPTEDSEAAQR